ncbi:MAG TPA: GlsB/YeaQ/YmgE family stress response membrane protein [Roseiflexaceae bacterium]|nr:GlsB/YeaQ/YmgE family stress response membrane protein [Roseiflexaceae bacterium]
MINLIIWLLMGALIGWLASIVMGRDGQQGALLNIVVGIIGAMIGGFLLGGPTLNQNAFNLTALIVSFVGAVVLLAIVNLVTRGRVR